MELTIRSDWAWILDLPGVRALFVGHRDIKVVECRIPEGKEKELGRFSGLRVVCGFCGNTLARIVEANGQIVKPRNYPCNPEFSYLNDYDRETE